MLRSHMHTAEVVVLSDTVLSRATETERKLSCLVFTTCKRPVRASALSPTSQIPKVPDHVGISFIGILTSLSSSLGFCWLYAIKV